MAFTSSRHMFLHTLDVPSCAIPSSGSSRPLLSYVSPLLVPFSPSSFLRSPGWLLAHVSSLLVQSPPSSLAILLSTITTHRASSSCGFPTSSLPLIALDDGMCKYLSGYVVFVQNTKCGDHEFLWRSCYPQLPPTGHRLLADCLLIYTF